MNPAAIVNTSRMTMCLSHAEYAHSKPRYALAVAKKGHPSLEAANNATTASANVKASVVVG